MKVINDFEKVQAAQEFKGLPPGGYVCQITNVIDDPQREFLKIEFDIADGEFRGHYLERYIANNRQFWPGVTYKSYSGKGLPFFKAFIDAVEQSNSGYHWNWVESTLKGKFIGFVLGEEEYEGADGKIKKRLYVAQIHTVSKIMAGDYQVPEFKPLGAKNSNTASAMNSTTIGGFSLKPANVDDNLPF